MFNMFIVLLTIALHGSCTNPNIRSPDVSDSVSDIPFRQYCEKIITDGQRIWFLRDHSGRMKLQMRGIYRHGDNFFFSLEWNNRTPLDYAIDSIRFQITRAVGSKHPPSLVRPLVPIYVY